MSGPSPSLVPSNGAGGSPSPPALQGSRSRAAQRPHKLRRGTASCCECRRRKIRCYFEFSSSASPIAICAPCRRRGCKCVPQRDSSSGGGEPEAHRYHKVGESIDRVESLVGQLMRSRHDASGAPPAAASLPVETEKNSRLRDLRPRRTAAPALLPRSAVVDDQGTGEGSVDVPSSPVQHVPDRQMAIGTRLETVPGVSPTAIAHPLSHLLRAVFPSARTIGLIIRRGNLPGSIVHKYKHTHRFLLDDGGPRPLASSSQVPPRRSVPPLDLLYPSAGLHPLVLARKLIELAVYLQQRGPMEPRDDDDLLAGLRGGSIRDAAACLFDAAVRHVTSSEHGLMMSVAGIEVLMLEGVYHVNTGHWRLGWLTFRRALGLAHLLGLHLVPPPPHPAAAAASPVSPPASETLRQDLMWFRLVYSDRFMSLLLGLPVAVPQDTTFTHLDADAADDPVRRLELRHASITARIAARNERMRSRRVRRSGVVVAAVDAAAENETYKETLEIDFDMKQAVRATPPQFWAEVMPPPTATDGSMPRSQVRRLTARLFAQLKHYNLLVLLHFPHFMHEITRVGSGMPAPTTSTITTTTTTTTTTATFLTPPSSSSLPSASCGDYYHLDAPVACTYSKVTILHASREVLLRFAAYRQLRAVPLLCRGFDFMALTASVVLLLAHLDGHRRGRRRGNALEHQRPQDLPRVESAADSLRAIGTVEGDELCSAGAMVLQKLMELEASAAAAAEREDEEEQYFIWREDGPVGEAKCAVVESDDELRLTVPHFGTIGIARRASAMAARFVSGLAHPLPPDWCSASLAAPPLSMPSQTPLAGTPLVVQPIVRKPATDVVGLDGVFQDFYMDNNGGTTMWTSSPENRVAHGDHDPQHWRDDTMLGESCAFYGRPHPGSYSRDLV